MRTEHQLTFDRYRLDLAGEQLWSGSQEILLPGKAFALLRYLMDHAGQLVSKAELFAALWPGTAVTDGALTFCIVELRKALGDKATAPRFIETVHRRGYRFIGQLSHLQGQTTATPEMVHQQRAEGGKEVERKLVAILSADAQGYSRLMSADEVATVRTLTAYREVLTALIHRHRGRVVDAPGDNLLAEFGSAVDAVEGAVAIQQALTERNAKLTPERRMEFRIGINVGDVVVEGERIYGDGVNMAARLEGLAEAGGLCISGTVYDQIKNKLALAYEYLGERTVKNIAEPVRVYRVTWESEVRSAPSSATTQPAASSQHSGVSGQNEANQKAKVEWPSLAPSPQHPAPLLIGREPELTQLHSWLGKALNGERQLVFVTGEPGIGKTTLVETFQQRLETGDWRLVPSPQASRLQPLVSSVWLGRGQCIEQYGSGEPYMPILEALGRLCRASDGEQLVTLLKQHAPTWLVQMPALLPAAELEVLQRQTQGVTRERMLREMGEAIDALTAERPLVLVLEDLHWSDASTVELLALLARRREPTRLLVLGTYRSVDVIVQEHPLRAVKQELQLHDLCVELPLGLLSEAQVAEYLAVRFNVEAHGHAPLQPLAQVIHRRTDGNPLFLVTAVEDLITQKVLVQKDDQWAVPDELAAIETRVPGNLQQLIERQIERLSVEDRRMLEVASVAGMEFSAATVAAGGEPVTEIVEERCEGLVRRGQFLRAQGTADWPDGTVAGRYSFLHALYQEVLYKRLPAGRRQRLHQRIGEREEQAYGERAREIAAALAVHFEQGRDYEKAVQYLQQAGENAVRRSAHQEALVFLRRGLALLPSLPETSEHVQHEVSLQLALGNALNIAKGYTAPEVGRAYTRARELCGQMEGTPQVLFALAGLFGFHLLRAELETAEELAAEILRFAQAVQVPALLVAAHSLLGATLLWRGQFTAARTHLEQGISFYSSEQRYPLGVLHPGVVSFSYAGVALWSLGYRDQALARCYEGITLAHEIDQPFSLAFAVQWTTWLHLQRGEIQQAQEQANRLTTLSMDWAFPFWETVGALLIGWLHVMQGRTEEGIRQLRQSIATFHATGVVMLYPASLATLAEACGKGGKPEEGLQVLPEALTVLNMTGQRHWEAELYRIKGELTLQQAHQKSKGKNHKSKVTDPRPLTPDPQSEAEVCFFKAIEVSRHQQAKSLELRATMSLARLWQQQGKHHEAHTMLSDIYGWFTEGFDTKDLQEARTLLEELT